MASLNGVLLVDTRRVLPGAEPALRHIRATTDAPVTHIPTTHQCSGRYGGLPVSKEAFPDAQVILDAVTSEAIRGGRFRGEPPAIEQARDRLIAR